MVDSRTASTFSSTEIEDSAPKVKIVVVGDGAVGKTCMIMCYSQDIFPTAYVPTVFDAHQGTSRYDGREVALDIWDTAGQQDLARMRPLAYPNTHCFIVSFSLVDKVSFQNACSVWKNELENLGPSHCPRLLVGLKADLREEYANDPSR